MGWDETPIIVADDYASAALYRGESGGVRMDGGSVAHIVMMFRFHAEGV